VKHEVAEHRLARIVHLATTRARCKDVAQFRQRDLGAVLGYQAGFAEQQTMCTVARG
jgi:hypothetical protein